MGAFVHLLGGGGSRELQIESCGPRTSWLAASHIPNLESIADERTLVNKRTPPGGCKTFSRRAVYEP